MTKSSVEQIRERFDRDVERFSNLETGQTATMDAALVLDLIAQTMAKTNPGARDILDVGCGAGNYTLKVLNNLPNLNATLIDLSAPMLDRAVSRVQASTKGSVTAIQGDIREVDLGSARFDVIVAAAVLHHLRETDEWTRVFSKFYECLKPGGSVWISDLVSHSVPTIQDVMWNRYADYLAAFKGEDSARCSGYFGRRVRRGQLHSQRHHHSAQPALDPARPQRANGGPGR
ncbi:MAG: class I SAM-dependent methyltransferase, partial [Bryobacteraceae bacterium]